MPPPGGCGDGACGGCWRCGRSAGASRCWWQYADGGVTVPTAIGAGVPNEADGDEPWAVPPAFAVLVAVRVIIQVSDTPESILVGAAMVKKGATFFENWYHR